ncbi:MAG: PDC sensor domain-containing protein, partial [Alphaproteobacteria bacterium]|nr:PDC sensor domain-containing protein [Alphaproteobacteria bacterium]
MNVTLPHHAPSCPVDMRTAIRRQREMLTSMISRAMRKLSRECAAMMGNRAALETRLARALDEIPYCKHLYVLDTQGVQVVSNITREGPDARHFGRDRSNRPYMLGVLGTSNFRLSDAYISRNSQRPSLTAIRVMRTEDKAHAGYLGADYDLRELPMTQGLYAESQSWRQIKGDPIIRDSLFRQNRAQSPMDEHIDVVLPLMTELITHHGVFHGKLHFASSRATIWLMEDPFSYRILGIDELTAPDICLAYPHQPYTERAIVPEDAIRPIFEIFRELRYADDNIYLRAG